MEEQLVEPELSVGSVQTLIIEDVIKLARNYYRRLEDVIENPVFVTDLKIALNFIEEEKSPGIYWVDIHLSHNKYEGVEILNAIKARSPDSLIIIYTAYGDLKTKCESLKLKNLHFFEKNAGSMKDDFNTFRSLIKDFTENLNGGFPEEVIEYYAQIAHVDEELGWIKLQCFVDGAIIERTIPRRSIAQLVKPELYVDDCFKVKIIHQGRGFRVSFKEVKDFDEKNDEIRKYKDDEDTDFSDDNFWNQMIK